MTQIYMSGLNFDFWGPQCARLFETVGVEQDGQKRIWTKGVGYRDFPLSEIVFLIQIAIGAVINAGVDKVQTLVMNERAALALYLLKYPFPETFDCITEKEYQGFTVLEITNADLWLARVKIVVVPSSQKWISDVVVAFTADQNWEELI